MKKLILGIMVMFAIFAAPRHAAASVQDFTVKNFEADYTLSNTDKQGKLKVVEKIDVVFSDYNHGIERFVPETYKDASLHIKVLSVRSPSGAPAQYSTYSSNHNLAIRIGDPTRTVTALSRMKFLMS